MKQLPAISLWMVLLTAAYFGFSNTWSAGHQPDVIRPPAIRTNKTILIWDIRHHIDFQVLIDRNHFSQCPIKECSFVEERTMSALHQADAVIFNVPPLRLDDIPIDPFRRQEQRYIFLSPEPPVLFAEQQIAKFNHIFNWTMSYRLDSDIPYLYGEVTPHSTPPPFVNQPVKTNKDKTKLVAWFVSHCSTQSRREAYVDQLSRYISVDIYGACSNQPSLQCGHNETTHLSDDSCYDMLERNYKFYLAFENSLCNDYVTEKFFKILQRRVIPVVLGQANYSAIAPRHSFIDARQFSPQKLAGILNQLASNDTLYDEFFDWKKHYSVRVRYPDMVEKTLCHLCRKLHTDQSISVYEDLEPHWGRTSQCVRARYKRLPLVFGVF